MLDASNAAELEAQLAHRPDVVVLDTELPGRTAFEFANRLKADPATATDSDHSRRAGLHDRRMACAGPRGRRRRVPHAPGGAAGADRDRSRAAARARGRGEGAELRPSNGQSTFDAITDAVCIIDESGELQRCNDAADVLLGQLSGGHAHRRFHDLLPPSSDAPAGSIADVVATGQPLLYDVASSTIAGSRFALPDAAARSGRADGRRGHRGHTERRVAERGAREVVGEHASARGRRRRSPASRPRRRVPKRRRRVARSRSSWR